MIELRTTPVLQGYVVQRLSHKRRGVRNDVAADQMGRRLMRLPVWTGFAWSRLLDIVAQTWEVHDD